MANTLLHSPADIVEYLLVDKGIGIIPIGDNDIWPVYSSGEPTLPDNCITIKTTDGIQFGRSQQTGEIWSYYGFQVRVRSKKPGVGWAKTNQIQTLLAQSIYRETVTIPTQDGVAAKSYLVHCIAGIGNVLYIGKEKETSKRNIHTLNALLVVDGNCL